MTARKRSISKKSRSGLKPRLKRTLKRKPTFREIDSSDLKFLWAAYKMGKLSGKIPDDLSPSEFDDQVLDIINSDFDYGWTFVDNGKPIGFAFGASAHPIVVIGEMLWLNASKRQIVEHTVNGLNDLRKTMKFVLFCEDKDHDFYVHVAKHGIIRRVGHINDLIEGKPMIEFESRYQ